MEINVRELFRTISAKETPENPHFHFYRTAILKDKLRRRDLKFTELTYMIIHDFDLYLRTVVGQNPNTATKTMKTFKTVVILEQKLGVLHHDPFVNFRFHLAQV